MAINLQKGQKNNLSKESRGGLNKVMVYDINRPTYIYNLCEYDAVIVVADTLVKDFTALESLAGALPNKEAVQLFYIQGGKNVWCMKQ